jgi:hypothetical protein
VASLLEMQSDARLAEAASAALIDLGAGHIGNIAHGLRHPQADVRRKTIDTLTRLGAREVEARLQELAGNDPSQAVRRAAADAAARLRQG